MDEVTANRFWAKVHKTDTCWLWTGSISSEGYGRFRFENAPRYAHRLSYELAHGTRIGSGLTVDHRCHTRSCVNPEHLRLATTKQNAENPGRLRSTNSSGVQGVSMHRETGKWCAKVVHHGKQMHLGLFADMADAEAAVIAKRLELFTHNDADRLRA